MTEPKRDKFLFEAKTELISRPNRGIFAKKHSFSTIGLERHKRALTVEYLRFFARILSIRAYQLRSRPMKRNPHLQ